ncbi:GNAT family N-acetyltransferase [Cognatishimia sp. F0-27]|nr:GNAT family N-acetyltransferase [Cognatishimia sp. F0-27]
MRAISETWPAAATVAAGPWLLREGRGGGKRVSAATAVSDWREEDIGAAEEAMRLMGQTPLFCLMPEETRLDAYLAARGYRVVDPVNLWISPTFALTERPLPPVTAFTVWEPLAIMRELWEDAGIGDARQAVMARVKGPKTGLFGRVSDAPAGTGFVALSGDIAVVHALEIAPEHRKKGLGGWMMRAAAMWAAGHRADWLAVLCTEENAGANALYESLGMVLAGHYHYRVLEP